MKTQEEIEYTIWHCLFIAGTFCSILFAIYLHTKVNWFFSIIPPLLWVGAYELSSKIRKREK